MISINKTTIKIGNDKIATIEQHENGMYLVDIITDNICESATTVLTINEALKWISEHE